MTWYTPDQKKLCPPRSNPPGEIHLCRSSCITLQRTVVASRSRPVWRQLLFGPLSRMLTRSSLLLSLLSFSCHPFPLILYCNLHPFTLSFCSTLTLFISLLSLLTLTYFMASNATRPKHSRSRLSSYLFHPPFFFVSYFSSILLYQNCSYKGFCMYLRAHCSVPNDQHLPLHVCAVCLESLRTHILDSSLSTRLWALAAHN